MSIRNMILAFTLLGSASFSFGQTTYSANVDPNNLAPLSTQKRVLPPAQLPDLKFTDLRVTATPVLDNGTAKYNITYSFTVTNVGAVAVLADSVTLQDYYTDEVSYPKNQDLRMTGYFREAGARVLSNAAGRGETLAPGATKVINGTRFNVVLPKSPKPIYLVVINPFGGPKESDATNNRAYTSIPL